MAANTTVVAMDTREDSYEDNAFVSDTNHFGSSMDCTEAFQCPITKDIMVKPVVLVADGTTYEEEALKDWLSENNISPLTGLELTNREYRPNYALQHAINDYLEHKLKHSKINNNNNNNSSQQTDGFLGVSSPRSAVSSDMDLEEELVSYHSDEEKRDQLTKEGGDSNKNHLTPGMSLISTTATPDIVHGEMDSRAAQRNAELDKLQIFLTNIDCADYIDIFVKEGFQSIADLYNITFPDLLAIGVPRGHGRRLLKALTRHKVDTQRVAGDVAHAAHAAHAAHDDQNGMLSLGDPTMSIIDDGSIVDISFHQHGNGGNTHAIRKGSDSSGSEESATAVHMDQSSAMAAHNASIIIYPGKKLPKSNSAAPLNANILLLGDANVGKTSLRKRLECNQFLPTNTTQGVELTCLSGTYHDDDLQITVWDPAGQERYAPITKTFFRRAHGAAIVFSADDEGSWRHVTYWLNELETNAPDDIEVMLVCNKVDLLLKNTGSAGELDGFSADAEAADEMENKQSELEDALIKRAIEVAQEKRIPFYMTSAKSGECVLQAFQELVSQIMINEGIVKKIYEARDGLSMPRAVAGKQQDGEQDVDTPRGGNKKYSLLGRLREQRKKYQSSGRFGRGVINLTSEGSDGERVMSGCTCVR